jgi:enamine deaminase RidA (YjgF/YER057c/UK114 family)
MAHEIIRPKALHPEPGLYSHGFVSPLDGQRLLVVSGQLGIKPDGSIQESFDGQFGQTYANLRTVLSEAGGSFENIVSLRTYLSRAELLEPFHAMRKEHYPQWFPNGEPPNTLLVVSQLYRPDLWLEIEALALLPA